MNLELQDTESPLVGLDPTLVSPPTCDPNVEPTKFWRVTPHSFGYIPLPYSIELGYIVCEDHHSIRLVESFVTFKEPLTCPLAATLDFPKIFKQ